MLVRLRMRGRKPQDLLDAKGLDDPEKIAALRILVALSPTAYFLSPDLLMFTALKVVNYSLRHGISPLSAVGFVFYGLVLGAAMDDYKRGYDFGRFALELAERSKDPSIICKVLMASPHRSSPGETRLTKCFRYSIARKGSRLRAAITNMPTTPPSARCMGDSAAAATLNEVLRVYEEHWPFVLHSKTCSPSKWLTMLEGIGRLPCRARPQRLIR